MTWQFIVLGAIVWILTLATYIGGYNAGKTAGYALGRSGGKLDDDASDSG